MHGLPTTTATLSLRHFVPADALQIMALNAEPSTRRWLPSHVYATADEARERVAYLIGCYDRPGHPKRGPYVLAVEEIPDSQLLGHVGFSPLDGEVEVSYAIAESARGRGYGAQALGHACSWVAQAFGVGRLLALTAQGNVASRRTLDHAGFRHLHDIERAFQGGRETVSHYVWQAPRSGA